MCRIIDPQVRRTIDNVLRRGGATSGTTRANSTGLVGGSPALSALSAEGLPNVPPLALTPTGVGHRPPKIDLVLLKSAEAIYGPSLLEERNLLLGGGKVLGVLDDAAAEGLQGALEGLTVQDCAGCIITPGFVDVHVHITGGGGEAGPASR